jgi:hypothetical protein
MERIASGDTMSATAEMTAAERSRKVLQTLVIERHALLSAGADERTLEANRLAIEYWQEHVARTLGRTRKQRRKVATHGARTLHPGALPTTRP